MSLQLLFYIPLHCDSSSSTFVLLHTTTEILSPQDQQPIETGCKFFADLNSHFIGGNWAKNESDVHTQHNQLSQIMQSRVSTRLPGTLPHEVFGVENENLRKIVVVKLGTMSKIVFYI